MSLENLCSNIFSPEMKVVTNSVRHKSYTASTAEKPVLDAAGVHLRLPLLWVHWRPWGGHPAWVEEVGLEAPQVSSRKENGAAWVCNRVLQGEHAGGGGEALAV